MSEQERPRLDYLRDLRDGLERRLAVCESDQNYAVMGRELRTVLVEIDDLGGGGAKQSKETGLSDFEKRLAKRQSAKGSRSAKSG